MAGRSSRPHREPKSDRAADGAPQSTSAVETAPRTGLDGRPARLASSTVRAVLVQCGLHRLSLLDRITSAPIRRYEHDHPGALLQVDLKELSNVPNGGG